MDRSAQTTPQATLQAIAQAIAQVIREAGRHHGARAAIVDGELTLTYRDSVERAETAARALIARGVEPGRPKGVMAGHRPTIRAFSEWARVVWFGEGDRYLIINPFFHTFGYKAGWVAAFLQGATVYPQQVFDAEAVLARIQADRISFLPGPPTLFLTMFAHPRLQEFDIASLRSAVTGAASVPPVLITRMREELGVRNVTTAYGLTECGGCATVCDPADSAETIAHTCGKALPGTEVRCADAEGWLHTGEVGAMDARGYLRITDRLKAMYITGGFNCYPAEIERLMAPHPAIAQVAVIGMPDERMGEVGCAFVVRRPGTELDEAGLIAWSRAQMASYKVPRRVVFDEAAGERVEQGGQEGAARAVGRSWLRVGPLRGTASRPGWVRLGMPAVRNAARQCGPGRSAAACRAPALSVAARPRRELRRRA